MSISRVTSSFMNNQAIAYLNSNMALLSALQQKLSSGQNINKPSDDLSGLNQVLTLSNTLRADTQYGKNIQDGIAEINTADTAINSMVTLVQRVQEITTQAANFTTNSDGRNAIALEVDQIINQLVQLGNTDIGGKYIFGGFKTDSPPFSRSGDDITYSGTLPTEAWQRGTEVARGVQVSVNTNGLSMLGEVQVTAAGPPLPPSFSASSQGLFKTLIELKQDLQASSDPNQLTEIRNRLDDLTTGMNTLLNKQAVVGSVSNQLELTADRTDERKSVLTRQYSQVQDINLQELVANLNRQQNVFQASLNITGRLMQTSILDYIK